MLSFLTPIPRRFFYQLALSVCFLSVTSKSDAGKILVQTKEITMIEAVDSACGYGTAITLKSGMKICSIEQVPQIEAALAAKRFCL